MPAATVRQCVILGDHALVPSSLREARAPAEVMPAALLFGGDRPLLAWLIREFTRFGVSDFLLLSERFSNALERAIPAIRKRLPHTVRITVRASPAGTGIGEALWQARAQLAERFLLCEGHLLFDANLARLLAAAAQDPNAAGWTMPRDAAERAGAEPQVTERLSGAPVQVGEATSLAAHACGPLLLDRRLLDYLRPCCGLQTDVLPRLAEAGLLRAVAANGPAWTTRLSAEVSAAQTVLPDGLRRRALFLDRDGVLNIDHGHVGTAARFEFVPGALDAVRYATDAGWHVFIATNQSGVARGYYTEADVRTLIDWIGEQARQAGGTIDDTRYCPYHEEAVVAAYRRASSWRKPGPGMLLDLLRAWEVAPARSVMIGDQPTDMAAASGAGMSGYLFTGGNLLDFVRPILDGAA